MTSQAEMEVPRDLLPALRENTRTKLEMLGDSLSHAAEHGERLDELCDEITRAIAAHRALARDLDAYPADAVRAAAGYAIREWASQLADDSQTVDQAESLVRRIRACEALQGEAVVA